MPYNLGYLKQILYNAKRGLYAFAMNLLNELIRFCGLIQYSRGVTNGVLVDQVGSFDAESVRGKSLIGNGVTYIDLPSNIVIPGVFNISFMSTILNSNEMILGGIGLNSKIGRLNTELFVRVVNGGASDNTLTVDFTMQNDITITRDESNIVKATVNGVETTLFGGAPQAGNFEFNRIMNDDTTSELTGELKSLSIDYIPS